MQDYPPPKYFQQYLLEFDFKLPLGSIIKIPPGAPKDASYKNLICTDTDKLLIYEVITTVADNSKFTLFVKQTDLRKLELQIIHVHPFKFLGTIFSNPRLKMCMESIFDDYFKRNSFMDGLGPSLTRETSKGELAQYIDDFALEVNVPAAEIRQLFGEKNWNSPDWDNKDWEKLVRLLLES